MDEKLEQSGLHMRERGRALPEGLGDEIEGPAEGMAVTTANRVARAERLLVASRMRQQRKQK